MYPLPIEERLFTYNNQYPNERLIIVHSPVARLNRYVATSVLTGVRSMLVGGIEPAESVFIWLGKVSNVGLM